MVRIPLLRKFTTLGPCPGRFYKMLGDVFDKRSQSSPSAAAEAGWGRGLQAVDPLGLAPLPESSGIGMALSLGGVVSWFSLLFGVCFGRADCPSAPFLPLMVMLQDKSLDFKLVQRICLLQKALDQAMASVHALQDKVSAYDLLESQLVQTEEYANVQEKIISNLQHKLAAEARWRSDVLQIMVEHLANLVDDQQLVLEHLRLRIQKGQQDVQAYLGQLTTGQGGWRTVDGAAGSEVGVARALVVQLGCELQAAQQHIQQIEQLLSRHQMGCVRMQTRVKGGPDLPDSVSPPADATADATVLQAVIRAQQQKIHQLQTELGQQRQGQAQRRRRGQDPVTVQDLSPPHNPNCLSTGARSPANPLPPVLRPRPRWQPQSSGLLPDPATPP